MSKCLMSFVGGHLEGKVIHQRGRSAVFTMGRSLHFHEAAFVRRKRIGPLDNEMHPETISETLASKRFVFLRSRAALALFIFREGH